MNATQFAKRRGRIEHQANRPHAWRVKAMQQLVNEARAVVVVIGRRVIGWKLPDGQVVCAKARFINADAADDQLLQIARTDGVRPKRPVRAYACPFCAGWHLTSQAHDAPLPQSKFQ
jgi:hypothetical protein